MNETQEIKLRKYLIKVIEQCTINNVFTVEGKDDLIDEIIKLYEQRTFT